MLGLDEVELVHGVSSLDVARFRELICRDKRVTDPMKQQMIEYHLMSMAISGLPLTKEMFSMSLGIEEDIPKKVHLIDSLEDSPDKAMIGYIGMIAQQLGGYAGLLKQLPNQIYFGSNGTGKTYTAQMILAQSHLGEGVYITSDRLYRLYLDSDTRDTYNKIIRSHLLVLDELGKEPSTAPFLVFLEMLLRDRINRNLSTIICTNLTLGKSKPNSIFKYGDSIISVIEGHYGKVVFSSSRNIRSENRPRWATVLGD